MHLLAHAMASDFTVAWHYSQREQLFFVMDQSQRPISLCYFVCENVLLGLFARTDASS
jgi:hypothetical protein